MDVWALPAGHQVDLGPVEAPDATGGPAGLGLAGRLLALLHEWLSGDGVLTDLAWYPGHGDLTDLRLVVTHTDGRTAGLRLLADQRPVLDVRLRRARAGDGTRDLLARPVRPGEAIQREFVVDSGRLTDHVPGTRPLLTTPDLIAWLEDTAADLLRARFAPGTASVGTWIGVRHTGPAGLGDRVTVRAAVADVQGRRLLFDVRARVGDRTIADGQVAQTLIRPS